MAWLFHPMLALLAKATEPELARYLQYLKTENSLLRARLPKQIRCTPTEKRKLLKLGLPLGSAINQLITIVSPRTFARWVNQDLSTSPKQRRQPIGRPKTASQIRDLIVQLATDNGWSATRTAGEFHKLGLGKISVTSVRNLLRQAGISPGPREGTWSEFLKIHRESLWACDFFTKPVWTLQGRKKFFVFFLIHVATRRVHIAGITSHPDGPWMKAIAHELPKLWPQTPSTRNYLLCDNDTKFTHEFATELAAAGVQLKKTAIRAPNQNAHAERWVQSIKGECLDSFIVFGQQHLNYLVDEYVSHYNLERPHQGLANRPIPTADQSPPDTPTLSGPVYWHERLGGLLRHYYRAA